MTDSDALKKLIKSRGLKLKYVADYLGLTSYGFALKLNNKQEFKTSEVAALCELLEIKSLKEKEALFFKLKDDLKSTSKWEEFMNPKFMNAPEREAYRMGYERGKQEGLQKAAMLIQLVSSDSAVFKENILQNSKEAVELRKIFTERGE